MLAIKLDSTLSFGDYFTSLCKKTSQKLHVLAKITRSMNLSKRRNLMNTFITSQTNHCSLVWTLDSRNLNNNLNWMHE